MAQNQELTEQASRHAVYVQRVAGGLDDEFLPFLDRLKRDIAGFVATTEWSAARQQVLLRELSAIQVSIYNEYNQQLILDLNEFGVSESEWQARSLNTVLPDDSVVDVTVPAPQQVITAANTTPMVFPDSDVAKQMDAFIRDWSESEVRRVNNIITRGWITGQTNQEIVREVSGKGGYLDKATRRNNEAIVRTSVNHVSTTARHTTLEENDDIVIGYRWVSTLDSRTSSECRSLDGRVFKFTDSYQPRPPYHPNCRSVTTPELDGRFKFDDSRSKRPSIGSDGREQVGSNSTYYGWLKRQTAAFQDETIGKTRGKLLRNGGLTSEEFARLSVDSKFRPLSLAEMKAKDPEAFENAGLG